MKVENNDKIRRTQKTIGIGVILWDTVDSWLKTDDAKNRGYHSKAQFATEAIRELLDQNTGKKLSYAFLVDLVEQQKELMGMLKKTTTTIEEHIEHVRKLEEFWLKTNFPGIENED